MAHSGVAGAGSSPPTPRGFAAIHFPRERGKIRAGVRSGQYGQAHQADDDDGDQNALRHEGRLLLVAHQSGHVVGVDELRVYSAATR